MKKKSKRRIKLVVLTGYLNKLSYLSNLYSLNKTVRNWLDKITEEKTHS